MKRQDSSLTGPVFTTVSPGRIGFGGGGAGCTSAHTKYTTAITPLAFTRSQSSGLSAGIRSESLGKVIPGGRRFGRAFASHYGMRNLAEQRGDDCRLRKWWAGSLPIFCLFPETAAATAPSRGPVKRAW